jgi:sulfonate transport system permease protein
MPADSQVSIVAQVADNAPATIRRGWRAVVSRAQGLVLPVLLLLVWEGVVRAGWIAPNLLPRPTYLIGTVRELASHGEIYRHVMASSLRVLVGFSLGAALAVLVGAIVGLSARAQALIDPTFQAIRAIPSLAWVPLLLLWFGIDELPKIILIAIGAFFPVYLNLVSGIHNVDRKLVELGLVHGLTGVGLVWRIFLPASLPSLFVGLRSGLSLAWMFLVAAELIAASEGLGYVLSDGRETGRADLVIVAIVMLALLGKLSDGLLGALERRCLHWRDVYGSRGA